MESKIVIFETNKLDGKMSKNPKFYPEGTREEERYRRFEEDRVNLGKKYGINGKHFLRTRQKGVSPVDYPDGKYILVDESYMTKEDYFYEDVIADIIVISSKYPNVIVGNPQADCPVIICEDRRKGYTALAHCGAAYVDRKLPQDTVKALIDCCSSNINDIYVYVGSCIKKESYIYDCYPKWAKSEDVWDGFIVKNGDNYNIDLPGAIEKQMKDMGITHIEISPIDTAKDPNYYYHTEEVRGTQKEGGQNMVGFFYKEGA
jgi:hypothetical protein